MHKINIKGVIVPNDDKWIYEWLGYDAVCPRDVTSILEEANGEDVIVEINSPGGDVDSGVEIYTAIRSYTGTIKNVCVGLAASIASLILVATKSEITPPGRVFLHNASSYAYGNYHDFDKASELLQETERAIVKGYMEKTGREESELLELMNNETLMTAEKAVEYGFCDAILENKNAVSNSAYKQFSAVNTTSLLSPNVIENVRNILLQQSNMKNAPIDQHKTIEGHFFIDKINQEKGKNMENNITTTELLTSTYPDLVQSIQNEARQEGIKEERERIKAIDEISNNLPKNLVDQAKYSNPVNAQDLAWNALKANVALGSQVANSMVNDIMNSGAEQVPPLANTGLADGAEMQELRKNKIQALADKLKR